MGVDSEAYLPGITRKEILSFIELIDRRAQMKDPGVSDAYREIYFSYKENSVKLHVHDKTLKKDEYIKRAKKRYGVDDETAEYMAGESIDDDVAQGLPENTSGLLVTMAYSKEAVTLLQMICWYFSGYFDERDDDSKDYYYLDKNYKGIIKHIWL